MLLGTKKPLPGFAWQRPVDCLIHLFPKNVPQRPHKPVSYTHLCEVDQQELKRLRGQCVEEIKRTNGMISFEQALQWQKE